MSVAGLESGWASARGQSSGLERNCSILRSATRVHVPRRGARAVNPASVAWKERKRPNSRIPSGCSPVAQPVVVLPSTLNAPPPPTFRVSRAYIVRVVRLSGVAGTITGAPTCSRPGMSIGTSGPHGPSIKQSRLQVGAPTAVCREPPSQNKVLTEDLRMAKINRIMWCSGPTGRLHPAVAFEYVRLLVPRTYSIADNQTTVFTVCARLAVCAIVLRCLHNSWMRC